MEGRQPHPFIFPESHTKIRHEFLYDILNYIPKFNFSISWRYRSQRYDKFFVVILVIKRKYVVKKTNLIISFKDIYYNEYI
jgi:ABC-type amino acid transport substrate-binding protein